MPVVIQGETYYKTAKVCRMAGISKNTLFRWLKELVFSDVEYRDWRGWRLFTIAQVEAIKTNSQHITALPFKRKELPVKPSDERSVRTCTLGKDAPDGESALLPVVEGEPPPGSVSCQKADKMLV